MNKEQKRELAIKRLNSLSEWARDCANDLREDWEPEICAVQALQDVCELAVTQFAMIAGA
jgi:hypothetical protein